MLYIFGAGGGAKELLESKEFYDTPLAFKKIICVEDNPERDFFIGDIPIISLKDFGQIKLLEGFDEFDYFFISCADVNFKQRLDSFYPDLNWVSFAHRHSDCLLENLGVGNWFGYGTHIPSDLKVGCHVKVNYNAVFGHDCEIGDYSFVGINASICATTKIGKGVYVGSSSVIINKNLAIGDWSVIGAGAVVTKDVPPGVVVMGIPARIVNQKIGQLELM